MLGAHEGGVEFLHQLGGARLLAADDHAVGFHEVVDRVAFLEELGVAHDVEGHVDAAPGELLADHRAHLFAGAHGHGRLVHDDGEGGHQPADVARDLEHVLQVRRAVLARRGPDGDEDHQGALDRLVDARREAQPLLARVAPDHLLEAGLVDRDLPAVEPLDLRLVGVDADDIVPRLGETGSGHQPDIPCANDSNLHLPLLWWLIDS